ncbi:MAG TPA: DegT/DnrJ/EryC1/StrS family aminotransferase [Allosphingosinicella sp.]|jgi:dTDP-4-amino-4,6-dideoxygalactose transaminase
MTATAIRDLDQAVGTALLPEEAWPVYAPDEIEAATDVLRSGRVNQWTGDSVFEFERACAEHLGGGPGIALANGSVALELALRAFGIGPGDEVIVSPRSFVASASCVRLVGATPVFCDVDPLSGNISAETIAPAITERTRAVIPVHIAGWPADMPGIMALAERHDLIVVEDCAQAHGAEIGGRKVGTFGDAAAFSFCQDKIISTGGEGGYLSFEDRDRWEWAWSFKDHGKSWQKKFNSPPTGPGFQWLHDLVGTNWRLTAFQAAIGIVQLGKLEAWREARTRNAALWARELAQVPGLSVPTPAPGIRHAFYKLYAYLDEREDSEARRDEILARAAAAGLKLFSGSCSEIYLEHAFDDLPRPDLPDTRSLGRRSLMVEVHPTLVPERVEARARAVARIVADVLG